jgi:hypothetical protein
MIGLVLLLALQPVDTFKDKPGHPQTDPSANEIGADDRYHFGIGPDFGFWTTHLGGSARVDGTATPGTSIDLIHDLNLPSVRGIPIYGGGSLYLSLEHDQESRSEVLFTAEYWSREWKGSTILSKPLSFGDSTFLAGSPLDSRLRLDSLDLAITYRTEGFIRNVAVGGSLLLRGTFPDLKLSSPTTRADQEFGDLLWGFGVFGEYRPFNLLLAGVSLKGYIPFGDDWDQGMADLRGYVGAEWRFVRLEGGIRYIPYSESSSAGHSLHYDLYGPYVALTLVLRF